MLDLVWRPRADLDRQSIALYLGIDKGSPETALTVIEQIDVAIDFVREFPDAGGRFSHDHLKEEYRTTLAGSYTIVYRYDDTTLTVYRIIHQRQDIDAYALIGFE